MRGWLERITHQAGVRPRNAAYGDGHAQQVKQSWNLDGMTSPLPPAARRELLLGPAGLWSLSVSQPQEVTVGQEGPGSCVIHSTLRRKRGKY